ncbi:MAG: flagellar hook-basal body complex protein FliE [Planctomycetes bacterium]|nr:flagellar hook-basal body complex protein FliE [Planctomycetota bacterium]
MPDPISSSPLRPVGPSSPIEPARARKPSPGGDFAAMFRQQLEQVSQMQAEADHGVQSLLTGETQNITEVFATARKAEVAFSLLMEIRNKLVDAYTELRQLRV